MRLREQLIAYKLPMATFVHSKKFGTAKRATVQLTLSKADSKGENGSRIKRIILIVHLNVIGQSTDPQSARPSHHYGPTLTPGHALPPSALLIITFYDSFNWHLLSP